MSSHKNNGEEMAWSSSTTHKVCAICLEELDMKAFPEQVHEGAAHDSNVCFECWRTHLADEVRTQRHDRIGCVECGASLHQTAVRRLASHDTFETLLDNSIAAFTRQEQGWMDCPRARCKCGNYPGPDCNIFICGNCEYRHCRACGVEFHTGETCGEYQERREREQRDEEKSSERRLAATKECPSCAAKVDKDGGCDHMLCTRFGHHFCWRCRAPYDGKDGIRGRRGNAAHRGDCPYQCDGKCVEKNEDEEEDEDEDEDEEVGFDDEMQDSGQQSPGSDATTPDASEQPTRHGPSDSEGRDALHASAGGALGGDGSVRAGDGEARRRHRPWALWSWRGRARQRSSFRSR